MTSLADRIKGALGTREPSAPRAHRADRCRDLAEARRRWQESAGRSVELAEIAADRGNARFHEAVPSTQDFAILDREILEAAASAIAWKRAVERLEREQMTPEEVQTLDDRTAAEAEVARAEQALLAAESEQAETEKGQRPPLTEEGILAAGGRAVQARARLHVARANLDRAQRAHAKAQGRAAGSKRDESMAEALAALAVFEEHAAPAASAMVRFEKAIERLDTIGARYCRLFAGPMRPANVEAFIRETRNLLRGRGVDDGSDAAA